MRSVSVNDDSSKKLINSSHSSLQLLPPKATDSDRLLTLFSYLSTGMLPSHMQHPFVDRYRDSHNASPRSLTDEETLNPPSSGNSGHYNLPI